MNNLSILARRFKLVLAQAQSSLQPSEAEKILRQAKLWDLNEGVAPLVAAAGVPDTSSVALSINIEPGPMVSFIAALTPDDAQTADKLTSLLSKKYAQPMADSLRKANAFLESSVVVKRLTF